MNHWLWLWLLLFHVSDVFVHLLKAQFYGATANLSLVQIPVWQFLDDWMESDFINFLAELKSKNCNHWLQYHNGFTIEFTM